MPTSDISKKPSIYKNPAGINTAEYVSEEDRYNMLQFYCTDLNFDRTVPKNPKLIYGVSKIEYEIQKTKGDTATIHTLEELRLKNPDATIVLAMGEDNARQLPWWSSIGKWPDLMDKLLLVEREGQAEAADKMFEIPSYKGITSLGFDKPSWAKLAFDKQIQLPGLKAAIEQLALKTELLPQPPGFSSSEVRDNLQRFYGTGPITGYFANLERFCGTEVSRYLVMHTICKPTGMRGGKRKSRRRKRV